jgi:hypothetical protein
MIDDGKSICIHCAIRGWKHRMCPWETETGLKIRTPRMQ